MSLCVIRAHCRYLFTHSELSTGPRFSSPRTALHRVEWPGMTEARTPWQQLLTEQHGLASTAQLLTCGVTPQQLRHRVQSGRWQQVCMACTR